MNIEPVEPDWYNEMALRVITEGGTVGTNEYGTPVSVHICVTCGERFTLCPPSTTYGPHCLMPTCASYDPSRDADIYFRPDDPDLIESPAGEPTPEAEG